jgi:hypothetical protein
VGVLPRAHSVTDARSVKAEMAGEGEIGRGKESFKAGKR